MAEVPQTPGGPGSHKAPPSPLVAWLHALKRIERLGWREKPAPGSWHDDPEVSAAIHRAVKLAGGANAIGQAEIPNDLPYFRDGFCEAYQAELEARDLAPTATDSHPEVMDRNQAAAFLGVAPSWLARHTPERGGPPMAKIGRSIRYLRTSLMGWLAENEERESTPVRKRSQAASMASQRVARPAEPADDSVTEMAARLARGKSKRR